MASDFCRWFTSHQFNCVCLACGWPVIIKCVCPYSGAIISTSCGVRSVCACLELLQCSVLWWSLLGAGETCVCGLWSQSVHVCSYGGADTSASCGGVFFMLGLELSAARLGGTILTWCFQVLKLITILLEEQDVLEAFGALCLCGVQVVCCRADHCSGFTSCWLQACVRFA